MIRWGESQCSVSLRFGVDGGEEYEIARLLDDEGNHSARLSRADQPDDPLARGVDAVDHALFRLLGYEYEEFIESFYLAQREITAPHPHSHAVKVMAGVAPLEYLAEEFDAGDRRDRQRAGTVGRGPAEDRSGSATVGHPGWASGEPGG